MELEEIAMCAACPKCDTHRLEYQFLGFGCGQVRVQCYCGHHGPEGPHTWDAIAAWNKQPGAELPLD